MLTKIVYETGQVLAQAGERLPRPLQRRVWAAARACFRWSLRRAARGVP
jgi:hypothetical protein